MLGFTFDGIHSSEFDLFLKGVRRPLLTTLRRRKLQIGGKNGTWDFGNNKYDDTTVGLVTYIANTDRQHALRQIAQWLSVKGKLVIDDEPDKYYLGRIYDLTEQELTGQVGFIPLSFECDTFAYSIFSTADDVLLGDPIRLDNPIPIGSSQAYLFDISGPRTIVVNNYGLRPVRPVIGITGSFSSLSITIGGKTLNYSQAISSSELIIDNENYGVTLNGTNKLNVVTGNLDTFLELDPGDNNVTISGTSLNCDIVFEFRPMF